MIADPTMLKNVLEDTIEKNPNNFNTAKARRMSLPNQPDQTNKIQILNQGEMLLDDDTAGNVFSEEHAQENVLSMADGEL